MSIRIRAIAAADKSAWQGLWAQYNDFYHRTIPQSTTDKTFERFLDPQSSRIYGAVAVDSETDNITGFVTYLPHPSTSTVEDTVYLQDLFVDPSIRNKGTGRKLIEYVYGKAKSDLGAASVYWHTQHFNHVGQLLYTKVATKTDFVQYKKML